MIAVLSNLISEQFEKATGIKTYPLKPYSRLDLPIATHADMLLCVLDNTMFCYKDYCLKNIDLFNMIKEQGYKIVTVEKKCERIYPNDISLNVLVIGKNLFCNKKYTAKEILEYAENNNYKTINVKQGYSACSTLVINDRLAITADVGIKIALEKENISVLLISSEGIKLEGYNCGFIGGSGAVLNNIAYFFGSIKNHPDFNKINKLLLENNIRIFEIIPYDVYDFGGVKLF